MDSPDFEKLALAGLHALPDHFRKRLANVAIVIEDRPTPAQRRQTRLKPGETLLGLYEGIPHTQRWNYNQALPDKITLFRIPLEAEARESGEPLEKVVRDTVWHEIAHHFGLDDEAIEHARDN